MKPLVKRMAVVAGLLIVLAFVFVHLKMHASPTLPAHLRFVGVPTWSGDGRRCAVLGRAGASSYMIVLDASRARPRVCNARAAPGATKVWHGLDAVLEAALLRRHLKGKSGSHWHGPGSAHSIHLPGYWKGAGGGPWSEPRAQPCSQRRPDILRLPRHQ